MSLLLLCSLSSLLLSLRPVLPPELRLVLLAGPLVLHQPIPLLLLRLGKALLPLLQHSEQPPVEPLPQLTVYIRLK